MSAEVEEFETSLKALVTAKRLSGSKLTALTELAMKNMKSDARIVSALFRTIRQVPSENKISTLYAFDSVARAAKNQAVKKGLSAKAADGNAATFMVKLEAIVEDVFSDLAKATTEVPEIREKMNKVLDLWSKGSTFPSHIMIRLKSYAGEADPSAFQVASVNTAKSVDPRRSGATAPNGSSPFTSAPSGSPPIGTPTVPNANAATGGIPPALLAILASAANAASSNPPPAPAPAPVQPSLPNLTTAPNPPPNGQATQYSAAQLALIQQLAIAGGIVPQATAPSEVSPSAPSPTSAISPVNGSNHPYNSSYEYRGRGGPTGRQYSSRDDYRGEDYYESDQRGGYHGGDSYRGRGRGRGRGDFGFRGGRDGNWGDRDGGGRPPYRGGHYESRRGGGLGRGRGGWANHGGDDGDDVPYQRRSRSRSPPPRRGGEGHDSPSDRNRPGYDSPRRRGMDSSRDDPGRMVDDFGREIRPDVEEEASPEAKTQPLPSSNVDASEQPSKPTQPAADTAAPPRTRPSRFSQAPPAPIQSIATFEGNTVHPPSAPSASMSHQQSTSSTGGAVASANNGSNTQQDQSNFIPVTPGEHVPYLYEFDFTSFDFSMPASWEALGKSFQVTNGYVPSQEELMAIVMMAMQTMQAAAMNQQWQQQEGWDMQQGSFDGDASAGDQMAGGGYANGQNQDAMNTDAPELSDETAAPTSNENGTSGATKPRATKDPRLAGRDRERDPSRRDESPSADRDMSLSPPDSPSD